MWKSRHQVVVLVLVVVSACAGGNLNTTWDAHYDFSGAPTYYWAPKEPESGPDLPYSVLDDAIKQAVQVEMSAAGFELQAAGPGFLLNYYLGVEEVTLLTDVAYYGPGWGASWGQGWFSPAGVNTSQYDAGTITLDVISSDPRVGLVWRGVAFTEIGPAMSSQQMESAVRSAVQQLLDDFPPEPER